jgi:polyhydroxyalkanoate synthase
MQSNEDMLIAARNLFLIWNQIALKLQKNPAELPKSQWNFWQNYLHLSEDIPGNMNNRFDKRFKHDDWKNNFLLDLIKRSYILFSQHSDELINNIAEGDTRTARKLRFYMQQFTDAVSPTNFANLNPEVFSETVNTSGANLVAGIRQFFADLDFGTGKLNAKIVDMNYFKV